MQKVLLTVLVLLFKSVVLGWAIYEFGWPGFTLAFIGLYILCGLRFAIKYLKENPPKGPIDLLGYFAATIMFWPIIWFFEYFFASALDNDKEEDKMAWMRDDEKPRLVS